MADFDPEARPRQVRVVSDGTPRGTAVYDVETGAPISGVMAVGWEADLDGVRCWIEIERVPAELIGAVD